MKSRKFVSLLLIAILLCITFAVVMIGCSNTRVTYSVTVLMPDKSTPVEGITVSWLKSGKSKGSAVTDADGKAEVSLPAGEYAVSLSGFAEGLKYTSVKMTASMNELTLPLENIMVKYSAKVLDKNGEPVKDVDVLWMNDASLAKSVKTNEDGVASCKLAYGEYSVAVEATSLPYGNIYNGSLTADNKNPDVQFNLVEGWTIAYTISVVTAGGLKYPDLALKVYQDGSIVYAGITNKEGVFDFYLADGDYTVEAYLPEGYSAEPVTVKTDARTGEMILTSKVIESKAAANKKYFIGDVINDFTFTTAYKVDGASVSYSIAELLKTKKAVFINNWGIQCTWCVAEMPAMQKAYEQYKDDIELIALDNYLGGDTNDQIIAYREENGYTFPMIRDGGKGSFASHFNFNGWPTTIVIDRYGVIAHIESGAIRDSEVWGRLIERFTGEEYVQNFVPGADKSESIMSEISKPDIDLPSDHYDNLAEAVNQFAEEEGSVTWFGETNEEANAWPFMFGTVAGVSPEAPVIYASNSSKPNSWAVVYAKIKTKAGKVFTFEYFAETEEDDIVSFIWDGKVVIKEIAGSSDGWKKCHLYSELTDEEHTLVIAYQKDFSVNVGKDNIFIRNVHFEDLSALTEPTDFLRGAAYGTLEKDAEGKPITNVYSHYAKVEIGADGFYHVVRSELENASFAGEEATPMLFANLMQATHWKKPLVDMILETDDETGEYIVDCNFTVNGVTKDWRDVLKKYMDTASASDLKGFVPVDKDLHDLLVAFTAKVSGEKAHPNEWLEVCYFYSHYGDDGKYVGNPIIGLTEKTAIPVTTGTYTAELTRVMAPCPQLIYTFTPSVGGVYCFESFIPAAMSGYEAQIWIYDDKTDPDHALVYCGDDYKTRDGKNEHNFKTYMYMEKGYKYYVRVAFIQMSGKYDFSITLIGNSLDVLAPASGDFYIGEDYTSSVLAGAIEYEKDEEGYYHALNADGTRGGYIYLDVQYAMPVSDYALTRLVDIYIKDPLDGTNLYKVFDFSQSIIYFLEEDEEGYEIATYAVVNIAEYYAATPDIDLSVYKDYTDIMKGYIAQGLANTGNEAGFVRVNQELVDILTLFMSLRNNGIWNNNLEPAKDNEWLRFCWYYKHYDENNAV